MNNLFLILFLLSILATSIFIIISLVQFIKKDKTKGTKQLKLAGVSFIVLIVSLIGFGTTIDSTVTSDEKKTEKVKTVTKDETKAGETEEAHEQKAKEESDVKAEVEPTKTEASEEVETETPVAITWQEKVKEIATMDGSPTNKYDTIMLYAKEYPFTDNEIAEFEKYIIGEYQSKKYLANITNSEYMIGNIFRANVINRFYGQVKSPMNDFAFDFYQNTKYTYRGVDTIDSDSTRANERQMDKALIKMGKQ